MTPVIQTPKGRIIINQYGRAELKFNPKFAPKWTRRFTRVQIFVDSEVLAQCEPYIPLLTSMLIKSGILGTNIGSGLVQWIAPYAKFQYYKKGKIGSQTGPLRGNHWFHRMKPVHGKKIIAGAQKVARRP